MRKQISKRVRFEVFKRDGFVCQYCGSHPPKVVLHVDHIVAVSKGGAYDIDNLTTACQPCNLGKSNKALSDVPQSLKDQAAAVAEREEQLLGYHAVMEAKRARIEDEIWQIAEIFHPGCSEQGLHRSYLQSIKSFLEKLGFHEVLEAMELAAARGIHSDGRKFRYFCAVCWNKVRGE